MVNILCFLFGRMHYSLLLLCTSLLLPILTSPNLYAQDSQKRASFLEREQLTGDWFGQRSRLADLGFEMELIMFNDWMQNQSGGLERNGDWLENITLTLLFDSEGMLGVPGSNMLFSMLQGNGGSISQYTGDVQGANNIEMPKTIRIYEWWLQQNFFDDHISLLAGLYDINSEFDYINSASLFIQSSQGLGGELAGSGIAGPPTYPAPGLAARLKVVPHPAFYLQMAVTDGNSSTSDYSAQSADFTLTKKGGLLYLAEMGFLSFGSEEFRSDGDNSLLGDRQRRQHVGRTVEANYRTKIAIGAWMYDRNYLDQRYQPSAAVAGRTDHDKGLYVLADWVWKPEFLQDYQSINFYFRMGITDNAISRFKSYNGGGVTFKGLFDFDPDGYLGFSVSNVQDSKVYQQIMRPAGTTETVLEFTYYTNIIPWLNIQPDIQYIFNPGSGAKIPDAFIWGIRTEITL